MNIIQQPDALSLSMNLKKFVLNADAQVSFVLKKGEVEILSQRYDPDSNGRIEIDVRDIVHAQLAYLLKEETLPYEQTGLCALFTAVIDEQEVSFTAVRGGVDRLADTATNFLTQNWLTWQPTVKPVTYYSPEFLTYYAVKSGVVKLKATLPDESSQSVDLAQLEAGKAYTIPVQYSTIVGKLGDKKPAFYDVWVEDAEGQRLTYIQRYYADSMRSISEDWVLFENSLGGLDCFRAYGATNLEAEHTHNLAEIDEVSEEYRVDTERKYQKNTGHLGKDEARWLLDFFPSQRKYIYTGSYLRQIVVVESDVNGNLRELPASYTFTYKYADARPLLNLPRTDVPADMLDITIPEVGNFTLPPRLAEVPRLPLSEGDLFPVQNPYSEVWGTTTLGILSQVVAQLIAAGGGTGHTHDNFGLLDALSFLNEYLLINGKKIKAGYADIAGDIEGDKYIHKDKEDATKYLLSLLAGVVFGKYVPGISGGKVNEKGEAELLSLLLRDMLTVLHAVVKGDVKSDNYKSGALGTGFGLLKQDENGHSYLEIDKLFVRIKAFFAELEIKKLSYAGGNFIFSPAGITLSKVEDGENSYKCYFTNDDGSTKTENLFRVDDLLLCQEFNIKPGVYDNVKNRRYWRAVTAVGDDWFELSKTDCETDSDTPREGDAVVVLGNKTDATRQNAIIISVYGEGSPSFTQHKGIKTYSLEGTEKTRISPDGNVFTGSFLFESGTSVEVAVKEAKNAATNATQIANTVSTDLGNYKKEVTAKFEATDKSITAAVTTSKEYTNTALAPVKSTADAAKKTADTTASDLVKFKETTTSKFQVLEGEISSKVSTTTLTETRTEILSTAATDATTKANNAKSAAISAAATDAQKKADAAKSAAISAAASDAAKKYATITTVTQMQTSITQLNNQISLKADKTTTTQIQSDLDKAESNISSLTTRMQSAEAKITPDAIKLTVKEQTQQIVADATKRTVTSVDASKLDQSKYYPVIIQLDVSGLPIVITVKRGLDASWGKPSWSTHASGFSSMCRWQSNGSGWGAFAVQRIVLDSAYSFANVVPVGSIGQLTHTSQEYVYVRGGSKYSVIVEGINGASVKLYSSGYTSTSSSPESAPVRTSVDTPKPDLKQRPTTSEITSSLTIDTSGISLLGKKISLKGMVTFEALDSAAQSTINSKASTSYVDSAKASAISTAAADATTKANNAKSAAISTAAADAQKKVDTLTGKLGDLAYKDMVGKAQLDTTVISGGYIVTSLINANYIKSNIITASYINSLAITTGKITVTEGGKIGGFTVQGDMLINRNANACVFFNDTAKGIVASVGANTMPATLGYPIPGRFESTKANGTGYTNVALYVKAAGAQYNRAIEASGAIITTGLIASTVLDRRVFSSANTYYVIDNIQNASYIAYFNADNCSIVLPRKSNLIKMLGVSSSASFSFRFMILADGPKSGKIYGRTSKISGCNTTDYPILKDWNGTANYDGYSVGSGDSYDLLLFYDGTTYVAFVLNQSK